MIMAFCNPNKILRDRILFFVSLGDSSFPGYYKLNHQQNAIRFNGWAVTFFKNNKEN